MDTHMTVSIILPTYNSAHTIKKAIESVLAQTYPDWELLVMDDGSTDNTQSVVANCNDPRITYIKQEYNVGLQKTLNHSLALAKGTYIARIDADDVWNDPAKLQAQVSFLEANTEYVLVGTGVIAIDTHGKEVNRYLFPKTDTSIRSRILSRNCFAHSAVLFRKEVAGEGYSESPHVLHAEDYELWVRMGLRGNIANIPAYMTTLTIAPETITARNRIIQARRILTTVWKYKSKYPNAVFGVAASLSRYMFFCIAKIIPIPHWLIRWMHRFSKSV